MKKVLSIAALLFAVACSSPENRTDGTSDSLNSVNENGVTNSPPGGSTDTSGSFGGDSTQNMGTDTQGGSQGAGTPAGGASGTGTSGSASGSTGSGSRSGSDTTRR